MPRQGDEAADLQSLLESLGGEVVELVWRRAASGSPLENP